MPAPTDCPQWELLSQMVDDIRQVSDDFRDHCEKAEARFEKNDLRWERLEKMLGIIESDERITTAKVGWLSAAVAALTSWFITHITRQ